MAIKSFDPRKHLEHELHSQRFEQLLVDAWEEVHETEPSPPLASRSTSGRRSASGVADTDPDLPSNQPFASLAKELRRH